MLAGFLTLLLVLVGFFLTFIVLLQRGRGGGVSGALGGLGGQSAFGTKAGDVFTRITIVVSIIWVVLNCASIFANRSESESAYSGRSAPTEIKAAPKAGEKESTNPFTNDPAQGDPQAVKPVGTGELGENPEPAPKEQTPKEKAAPAAPKSKAAEPDDNKQPE